MVCVEPVGVVDVPRHDVRLGSVSHQGEAEGYFDLVDDPVLDANDLQSDTGLARGTGMGRRGWPAPGSVSFPQRLRS